MDWSQFDDLLEAAIEEDSARHDVTTLALVPPERTAHAEIVARESGVLCGLPLAGHLTALFDPELEFEQRMRDGERVAPGARVAGLRGPAGSMLSLERTMLNFLQRLSGISTLTARFVERVSETRARIYDTRKTTPGWRRLEKYAVECGGGYNHRMSLGDMVLIKENHLALMGQGSGGQGAIREAVRRAREEWPGKPVEVEVERLEQLRDALAAAPDIVMLDNMTAEQVARGVEILEDRSSSAPRPKLEASGGITLANVEEYAAAGADRIALGALTHSAPALDIAMSITG
jgi:nicotinate-nucleotide pyrophosphorylase (carboxylating)